MATSVTNPQDGGGPSGLSPAGEINSFAMGKFLNPSSCGSDMMNAPSQAGVVAKPSMADLAARKGYGSPTAASPAPVGAAMSSVAPRSYSTPAPQQQAAPVATPNGYVPAPVQQQQSIANESVNQQLERMGAPGQVKQNMRKMTFSLQREATLAQLAHATEQPGKLYSIMSPLAGERAVVTTVRVTKVSSSSPQSLGVSFDDLTPKFKASRPGQERGAEYHVACPRAGMPAECDSKEVFRLETMARPDHLINYGGIKSIEDVKKEVEMSDKGTGSIYLDGTVLGSIIMKNNPRGVMVHKSEGGRPYVMMKKAKIDEYIGEVDKLLKAPEFQRCLTDLSAFNMTLVPLNESGDWSDVAEWRGASGEDEKKVDQYLKTPFMVHVEGEMDIMILKK